ncbi:hypothetical protein [Leptospira interrogans]|uniref:hypothetical protein n=1 Tax=Leptospira interrogans TaxID=173 RepID=UPI001F0E58BD|nr:hypothetical protein [Leptospira interrogans]UMQ60475.1 hypothetical protein FH585_21375 [Leptospira interrogans]UMQ60569.1 hypothetical protein FH585_21270 [Leptospira interrogans]
MSALDPLMKFKEPKHNLETLNKVVREMEDHNHDEPTSMPKWIEAFENIQDNFSSAYGEAVEFIKRNNKKSS